MLDWSLIKNFVRREWPEDPDKASPVLVRVMDELYENAAHVLGRDPEITIEKCWEADDHGEKSFHATGQAVTFRFGPDIPLAHQFALITAHSQVGDIGLIMNDGHTDRWDVTIRSGNIRKYWYQDKNAGPMEMIEAINLKDLARGY
jgi:hypothetical protein